MHHYRVVSENAIYRELAILSDIRPLFEYCGRKITIRLCSLCGAQFVRLGRVPFGKTDLPVHQQQSCEIVDSKTIVLGIGKCPFCVLYLAATVSREVSQSGGVTAYDFDPPAAIFLRCLRKGAVQNAEGLLNFSCLCEVDAVLHCLSPEFPWNFHVFAPRPHAPSIAPRKTIHARTVAEQRGGTPFIC